MDKITLRQAMENPAWLMVFADDPEKNIEVRMTYADLYEIYRWIEKNFEHRKDRKGVTYVTNEGKKREKKRNNNKS